MFSAVLALIATSTAAISPPEPINPATWTTFEDNPDRVDGKSGLVEFLISVSSAGEPVRCDVTLSSGTEKFDRHVCSLFMARSKFEPAKDLLGQPVASGYSGRFHWSSSTSVKPKPKEPDVVLTVSGSAGSASRSPAYFWVLLAADSEPQACALSSYDKRREIESEGCAALMKMRDLPTALDAQGHPVRSVRSFVVKFELEKG